MTILNVDFYLNCKKKKNLDLKICGCVRMGSTWKCDQARVPPALQLPTPTISKVNSFFNYVYTHIYCMYKLYKVKRFDLLIKFGPFCLCESVFIQD